MDEPVGDAATPSQPLCHCRRREKENLQPCMRLVSAAALLRTPLAHKLTLVVGGGALLGCNWPQTSPFLTGASRAREHTHTHSSCARTCLWEKSSDCAPMRWRWALRSTLLQIVYKPPTHLQASISCQQGAGQVHVRRLQPVQSPAANSICHRVRQRLKFKQPRAAHLSGLGLALLQMQQVQGSIIALHKLFDVQPALAHLAAHALQVQSVRRAAVG